MLSFFLSLLFAFLSCPPWAESAVWKDHYALCLLTSTTSRKKPVNLAHNGISRSWRTSILPHFHEGERKGHREVLAIREMICVTTYSTEKNCTPLFCHKQKKCQGCRNFHLSGGESQRNRLFFQKLYAYSRWSVSLSLSLSLPLASCRWKMETIKPISICRRHSLMDLIGL